MVLVASSYGCLFFSFFVLVLVLGCYMLGFLFGFSHILAMYIGCSPFFFWISFNIFALNAS